MGFLEHNVCISLFRLAPGKAELERDIGALIQKNLANSDTGNVDVAVLAYVSTWKTLLTLCVNICLLVSLN